MEKHWVLSDREFENQFKNCELDASVFSHEAHLRIAWIYIQKYGIEKAISKIQEELKSFVAYLGAQDKYNTTLTIAAIKAVYHFILKSQSDNFKNFIVEFPRLKYNFKELMNSHYKIDIFNSEKAKKEFLEPDLLAFD